MARAKRTDRAEARRRYRAQLAAEGGEELDPAEDAEPAAEARGPVRTTPRAAAAAPPAPQRPGIGNAFRAAFRPANFREDLAGLPQLVRHRSVWLPALISIGTTAVFLATGGRDPISFVLTQYFVATPVPIGAVFLSGFLAPRASYLTGAIAGLVGAACLAVLVAADASGALGQPQGTTNSPPPSSSASIAPSTSTSPSAGPSPASGSPAPSAAASSGPSPAPSGGGTTTTLAERAQVVATAFLLSPLMGAFLGAAAAWYRRFLNLANPNRGARRQQQTKGKPRRR